MATGKKSVSTAVINRQTFAARERSEALVKGRRVERNRGYRKTDRGMRHKVCLSPRRLAAAMYTLDMAVRWLRWIQRAIAIEMMMFSEQN
jgi:hypothetical protein